MEWENLSELSGQPNIHHIFFIHSYISGLAFCIMCFFGWVLWEVKEGADAGCSVLSSLYDAPSTWLIYFVLRWAWASLLAQTVKNPPAVQETQVQSLGQEDAPEEEMATHSSILAWEIPWTEKPGGLQSVGSQRVGHDWATKQLTSKAMSLWARHHGEQ